MSLRAETTASATRLILDALHAMSHHFACLLACQMQCNAKEWKRNSLSSGVYYF